MRRYNWLGLTLILAFAACQSMTEAGESGTQWDITETATETRGGVTLVISYNSGTQSFEGTVRNTTGSPVTDVRVEIHLSNGNELGPTPRVALNAGETKPVTLDARGQNFDWYSVHVELGGGDSG